MSNNCKATLNVKPVSSPNYLIKTFCDLLNEEAEKISKLIPEQKPDYTLVFKPAKWVKVKNGPYSYLDCVAIEGCKCTTEEIKP